MMQSQSNAPGDVAGAAVRSGVRRVNNLPLYLIGGVGLVFVLVLVVVIGGRGDADPTAAAAVPATVSSATPTALSMAQQLVGNQADGIVPEAAPAASAPPPLVVPIARVGDDEGPPMPPEQADVVDPELQRLRILRLQQVQQALSARTGVLTTKPLQAAQGASPGAAGANTQADRGPPPYLPSSSQNAYRPLGGLDAEEPRRKNDLAQFASSSEGDRWLLDSRVEAPRTPFTLRAGFVIPAVLISGVNSDLPGQIIGQVSQDVYDTATGRHRVIPQGTRLVGAYSSEVAYGQRRVLVAWQRLVFPDGRAMDIGAMPGTDSAGYAGMEDRVNNHYLRIFGQAVLLSGVIAGVELSQKDRNNGLGVDVSAGSALSQALGQSLGQALTQLFQKNLNIAPTLEVRPGFRFNVMVVKDLDFDRPYVPMTY